MSSAPWSSKMTKPACFERGEWSEWSRLRAGAESPCTDCTHRFQSLMIEEGRCDHPEVLFARVQGEYVGLRGTSYGYRRVLDATPYSPALERRLRSSKKLSVKAAEAISTWAERGRNG